MRDIGVTGVQTCTLPILSSIEGRMEEGRTPARKGALRGREYREDPKDKQIVAESQVDAKRQIVDRKSVEQGKSVDLGGRRIIKKKTLFSETTIHAIENRD